MTNRAWLWMYGRPPRALSTIAGDAELHVTALRAISQTGCRIPAGWTRALVRRACHLVIGEPVASWDDWWKEGPGSVPLARHITPRYCALSVNEAAQGVTRLDAELRWLSVRRRRMYERPLKNHAFDVDFCRWLRSLDDLTAVALGRRFLPTAPQDMQPEAARARLALLRPMPLALLWQAHVFYCANSAALNRCNGVDDVYLEYVTLFAATHACRAFAEYQRTHMTAPERWPNHWRPPNVKDQAPRDYINSMLEEADLQILPIEAIEALAEYRLRATETARSKVLQWRAVLGPKCIRCAADEEENSKAAPGERRSRLKHPPFRVGCGCQYLFDPENDPYIEAPPEADVLRWAENGGGADKFPGMRALLHVTQQTSRGQVKARSSCETQPDST